MDPLPAGNPDHTDEDQGADSTNARDQMLLKALQDFIVPLIQATGQNRQNDTDQMPLGPEAANLITALQKFIASITVRAQSKVQNEILVDVVEEQNNLEDNLDNMGQDRASSSEVDTALPEPSHSGLPEGGVDNTNNPANQDLDPSEQVKPTFQDKLLMALREHIFNMMPIRLLRFEPYGGSLKISLLERGEIYTHIASVLRSEIELSTAYLDLAKTEQQIIARLIFKHARYSILSHTWLRTSHEVTYSDWNNGLFNAEDSGYQKLVNFCKTTWRDHGLTFGWMDTVCINKDSSSELDESIRSMYNWYSRADVCITYLAETETIPSMHKDNWFTRGWTLQELLAPDSTKFYNAHWKRLVDYSGNDKEETQITDQIEQATGISKGELDFIFGSPFSRRMQLAARREVTREEDQAYSLMGIFGVSFSTAYGEGAERAFFRLLQEILATSTYSVLDIFNWAGKLPPTRPHTSRILPSSPVYYYLQRAPQDTLSLGRPMEPLTLTHLGVRVPVVLMPAMSIQRNEAPALRQDATGDYYATTNINSVGYYNNIPNTYNILDKRVSGRDGWHYAEHHSYQLTFAVFNIHADATRIRIPKLCIAKALMCSQDAGKVSALGDIQTIETDAPIVFRLDTKASFYGTNDDSVFYEMSYGIKPDNLTKHGMQLVSLYL